MALHQIDLETIIKLDSEFSRIQDFDLLLERILLEARTVVNADAGSIYVPEDTRNEKLAIKHSQNDTMQRNLPPGDKLVYSYFTVPINEKTISGYCAYTKKIVNVIDAYNLPPGVPYSFGIDYDRATGYKTISILAIPLLSAENRLLGVIQLINARDKDGVIIPFSDEAVLLITHFAINAAFALERAAMTRSMILRMIRMAELRDPKETGAHVNRVAGYAVEIYDRYAYKKGIDRAEQDKYRDTLRIASMLHDVGKVAISDLILKKPGRFTPEEYTIMQHHTSYGASLFDDLLSEIDTACRDVVLFHHENWDGKGYPHGKTGEELPLSSRIVALADVFDALCSRRVYKEPWSDEQVLNELRSMSGTKFDPDLVDVFFEVLPNIKRIRDLFPEQEH